MRTRIQPESRAREHQCLRLELPPLVHRLGARQAAQETGTRPLRVQVPREGEAVMKAVVPMPAVFSDDRAYRYFLRREWDGASGETVCWILLNPSTADETVDDPTIRRCIGFSKSWGYEKLCVVNLFAFRATSPTDMKTANDPVGPMNNRWIIQGAEVSDIVIAGWGQHGSYRGRSGEVRQMLMNGEVSLFSLRRNKNGQPSHPLYLPAGLQPKEMA